MATGRRHRRSSRGKPKTTTSVSREEEHRQAGPTTTTVHDVPDHLLALILLRLDSSASLLRAAAACRLWRRTIADAGFLTRFRALHAPRLAGHYHSFDPDWVEYGSPPITGSPVFVPACVNSTVDTRRFALDFLPHSNSGWAIADSRGSLLLLFKRITGWAARAPPSRYFHDLLVCDPLTRRCQGILRPDDLAYCCLGVFLLDGDDRAQASGVSNFRLVSVLHDYFESEHEGYYKPAACVFSPGNDSGGWRVLPSASTNSDGITLPGAMGSITFAGRVNGSIYWVTGEDGAMLVLDEATMAFSRITFPAHSTVGGSYDKWSFRVIGGGDGTLRVVRMVSSNLKIFARRRGSDEWVLERFLRLPEAATELPGREDGYWYFQRNAMIVAAHETYILVTPQEKTCLFSVDLQTMEVECEHERNRYPGPAYPCELPWPPALEACAAADHHGRRRRCR